MGDKECILRGIVVTCMLPNNEKNEILAYLEELIEKASMYDGLCD